MNKRRIILATYIGAISLSVATLGMSVAWYASSTRLRIENITITIDCERQLAISTKPNEGYKAALKTEDLKEVGDFYPVTSAHTEWYEDKKTTPEFYVDTIYSEQEDAELSSLMTTGFFSQQLYLKADDDVIVTINPEESYMRPSPEHNRIRAEELHSLDPSISVEEYEERLSRLVNAMRYSILITDKNDYNFVIVNPNKSVETYYAGILDCDDDDYFDYYQSNEDGLLYERVYGEFNDKQYLVYDDPLIEDSDYVDSDEEPHAFNARHKKGVKRFNLEKSLQQGLVIKKEESLSLDDFSSLTKPFRFPVYRDKPQEIVLSIYIEGWDLESVNCTKGATFDSNLSFIIEQEL